MRLIVVPVAASGPVTFHNCLACGNPANQAHGPVLADLDGPAYAAYYHKACITEAR